MPRRQWTQRLVLVKRYAGRFTTDCAWAWVGLATPSQPATWLAQIGDVVRPESQPERLTMQ